MITFCTHTHTHTHTHTQGATDVKRVAEENSILEPYIIVIRSPDHYSQAFMIIDGRLIGEIKYIETVSLVLLASFMFSAYAVPKDLVLSIPF